MEVVDREGIQTLQNASSSYLKAFVVFNFPNFCSFSSVH